MRAGWSIKLKSSRVLSQWQEKIRAWLFVRAGFVRAVVESDGNHREVLAKHRPCPLPLPFRLLQVACLPACLPFIPYICNVITSNTHNTVPAPCRCSVTETFPVLDNEPFSKYQRASAGCGLYPCTCSQGWSHDRYVYFVPLFFLIAKETV